MEAKEEEIGTSHSHLFVPFHPLSITTDSTFTRLTIAQRYPSFPQTVNNLLRKLAVVQADNEGLKRKVLELSTQFKPNEKVFKEDTENADGEGGKGQTFAFALDG